MHETYFYKSHVFHVLQNKSRQKKKACDSQAHMHTLCSGQIEHTRRRETTVALRSGEPILIPKCSKKKMRGKQKPY